MERRTEPRKRANGALVDVRMWAYETIDASCPEGTSFETRITLAKKLEEYVLRGEDG